MKLQFGTWAQVIDNQLRDSDPDGDLTVHNDDNIHTDDVIFSLRLPLASDFTDMVSAVSQLPTPSVFIGRPLGETNCAFFHHLTVLRASRRVDPIVVAMMGLGDTSHPVVFESESLLENFHSNAPSLSAITKLSSKSIVDKLSTLKATSNSSTDLLPLMGLPPFVVSHLLDCDIDSPIPFLRVFDLLRAACSNQNSLESVNPTDATPVASGSKGLATSLSPFARISSIFKLVWAILAEQYLDDDCEGWTTGAPGVKLAASVPPFVSTWARNLTVSHDALLHKLSGLGSDLDSQTSLRRILDVDTFGGKDPDGGGDDDDSNPKEIQGPPLMDANPGRRSRSRSKSPQHRRYSRHSSPLRENTSDFRRFMQSQSAFNDTLTQQLLNNNDRPSFGDDNRKNFVALELFTNLSVVSKSSSDEPLLTDLARRLLSCKASIHAHHILDGAFRSAGYNVDLAPGVATAIANGVLAWPALNRPGNLSAFNLPSMHDTDLRTRSFDGLRFVLNQKESRHGITKEDIDRISKQKTTVPINIDDLISQLKAMDFLLSQLFGDDSIVSRRYESIYRDIARDRRSLMAMVGDDPLALVKLLFSVDRKVNEIVLECGQRRLVDVSWSKFDFTSQRNWLSDGSVPTHLPSFLGEMLDQEILARKNSLRPVHRPFDRDDDKRRRPHDADDDGRGKRRRNGGDLNDTIINPDPNPAWKIKENENFHRVFNVNTSKLHSSITRHCVKWQVVGRCRSGSSCPRLHVRLTNADAKFFGDWVNECRRTASS